MFVHTRRSAIRIGLLALALAVAACTAPTPAASPTPDAAPEVVGIYKAIMPGASSPGIDATLYLNFDGSARQVYDYLNEMPPLSEVGTWTVAQDGTVTLTLTGSEDGQVYEQPAAFTLQPEDGTLAHVWGEDQAGALPVVWYEVGALAAGQLEIPYDAEAAALRMERELADIYKAFLPAATCCARDISLSLQIDGIAVQKTDFLNGEAPIEEVGTWETTGPDTLQVTLNSQQDKVYEEPVVTEYTIEDGTLRSEDGTTLRSVYGYVMALISRAANETATFLDMDGTALTEDDLSNAEYDLPDLGTFQLRAGRYEDQYGSGATEVNRAFYQASGFGDLDGDGADDAAAVIATELGGSGSFYYLAAMLNREGQPQQAGQAFLGDRVQVQSIGVEEGTITVIMKVAGPDDPLCCPSQTVTRIYRLQEDGLELVEEQLEATPVPDAD